MINIPIKIKLIKTLLQEGINNIDAGNSNITEEEADELIDALTKINRGVKDIVKDKFVMIFFIVVILLVKSI